MTDRELLEMAKTHKAICIGGPADGSWLEMEFGIYSAQLAFPPAAQFSQSTDKPTCADAVTHEYKLMQDPRGRIAWVHSDSVGEFK